MTLRRHLPDLWAAALAVLLLGPALGAGYVLSYDMVWVPDLALRPDFLGFGSGVPRAVPSDAVVSVLDEVVPGMLLQKVVLVGALVGAAAGLSRLVPDGPGATFARLVAVTLTIWNPYVIERLLIGHWPVLLGYAVLPWVIRQAQRWRRSGTLPPTLLVLLPLGSLSVSAGLATAAALLAFAAARDLRRWLLLGAIVLCANLPWLAAGVLHAGDALTTRTAVELFALRGEGSLPAPLAVLMLGGIWNAEVVITSLAGVQAWILVLALVGLAAVGARPWWRHQDRRDAVAYVACWSAATAVPLLTWLAPGLLTLLVEHVPGSGVVRDGSRTLALAAPTTVLVVTAGARALWGRLAATAASVRLPVALLLTVFPLALLPDAAWGVSGRLDATAYPDEYAEVRDVVAADQERHGGDVLLTPFSSYRAPAWLDGRKVLDPTGRYLTPDYVASDTLIVSGRVIAGEDPRGRLVASALRLPTPADRAERLAELGIRYVVAERGTPGERPEVAGTVIHDGPVFRVTTLSGTVEDDLAPGWLVALAAAWAAFVGSLLAGGILGVRRARRTRE